LAVAFGAALQARLEPVFQIANQNLRHRRLQNLDAIMIANTKKCVNLIQWFIPGDQNAL
jgi:hypothetical protein